MAKKPAAKKRNTKDRDYGDILNGRFCCRRRRDVAFLISLFGLFDRVVVVAG